MDIDLEYYKIFYYVGKMKSITLAAEELAVSQPAVSQAIRNLEEALADLDLDTPSMAIPEMLDAFGAYDPDAQMADYYAAIDIWF